MSILDVAEGDLIEVMRDHCDMRPAMYKVTSAVKSEDGSSVTLQTEPWTGEAALSPYRSEVYQDEPTRCWFGP